jgi:hypothetical protein
MSRIQFVKSLCLTYPQSHHRAMEVALQPDQTPQRTGLQSPYTSNFRPTLFPTSNGWSNIATGTTIGDRSIPFHAMDGAMEIVISDR